MIRHITPDELSKVNMLMFLQRVAGIETSYGMLLEGWRSLSEPAKADVIEAYKAMTKGFISFETVGRLHVVPSSAASARNR